jgi:hypothetical protein
MRKCGKCGIIIHDHISLPNHQCPPIWYVSHDEYMGDDLKEIRAYEAKWAAEEYAKFYDQDDHPLIDGEEEIIVYDNPGRSGGQKFIISGEFVPGYTAREG